jgi:dTDP-4-amino-4,6-dideoxygalactose transaminase
VEVPFNDLRLQYDAIKHEIDEALHQALHEFNFIRTSHVKNFEDQFAALLGTSHCVATGNGTDSLFLALKAMGIGLGDEVITPAFSWISSAEVISLCGAKPVFVDVHPETFTLDPEKLESKINERTKAVIVVHLYGHPAAMNSIKNICLKNNLRLIEDCAQAQLSSIDGNYTGTFGDISTFSFYPTKNLGAYGDAGCVVTPDATLAERVRRLANHGALIKDDHLLEGMNSRMDSIQASILSAKLPHLKNWNARRQLHARFYAVELKSIAELELPTGWNGVEHTFHLYVVRTKRRDDLREFLKSKGVQTIIHYPEALPNLQAYRYLHHQPTDYPVATLLSSQVLSLPIYPELKEEQIAYVCENIKEFFKK